MQSVTAEVPEGDSSDSWLGELVRKGLVRLPVATEGVPPRFPLAPTEDLLAELDADRDESGRS